MAHWGSLDSGILRKTKTDKNLEDILVFGYSCKIFRDDEKALYIDQGKHLIPWMGDDKLKIDRYDCRGALSDIKQYEASREGYDAMRWLGLSDSERKLEELCDNERYYSLEINEEEEEMYKEEEAKRVKTNTISFNYDTPQSSQEVETKSGIPTVPEKEEEDELYVPSPVLDVPVDISIPKTVKEYVRIEKTALFVCRQGLQMEILIKAKQSDNPQFSFLMVNDPLYKFYRHVLSAFKNGRYQPQNEIKTSEQQSSTENEETDQSSHYLHPSLMMGSVKAIQPSVSVPSIPYRPSADCSYSQLVNRIQGSSLSTSNNSDMQVTGHSINAQDAMYGFVPATSNDNINGSVVTPNIEQQYYQYYYVQQWYEYWRHAVLNGEQGAAYANLPTDFMQLDANMQNYIHQMAWNQYSQQQKQSVLEANSNNNSYAQIVSNLNKDGGNPYTANVPQLPEEPEIVSKDNKNDKVSSQSEPSQGKPTLLSLAAAYGSDSSDSDMSDTEEQIKTKTVIFKEPSGDAQVVIDKMADYVFKNGIQFEEIIKQKNDSRFDFLNETHEYYKYYRSKLNELKAAIQKKVKHQEEKIPKPKKIIAPVSFSIKKAKEDAPKEIKSALPLEESSDEESYLNSNSKSPQSLKEVPQTIVVEKVLYKIGQPIITTLPQPNKEEALPVSEIALSNQPSKIDAADKIHDIANSPPQAKLFDSENIQTNPKSEKAKEQSLTTTKNNKSPIFDIFDTGTDSSNQQHQTKDMPNESDTILELIELGNEDKSDDKLSDPKDKALQLERKRKAAMFLKLKSAESSIKNTSSKETKLQDDRRLKRRSKSRESRRSRSREIRKEVRKVRREREKSETPSEDDKKRKKEKKKKSHKRKHSESKSYKSSRKVKKHKHSRSRSKSKSRSRYRSKSSSKSRSRSHSRCSHISIDS
ncbi:splicing factor, suppressor of white-apricot homolog [Sitophilus oryzae]|uniref:Splicing factor, suppressor of white-apricot homolog n=1 Tax=Sitophilus oryzae TaxID=7048 RepID=A0A6J2YL27_SITOR|nr:splicing factor, suppressor of white-apricot homolog [Sitophilus oryzae]